MGGVKIRNTGGGKSEMLEMKNSVNSSMENPTNRLDYEKGRIQKFKTEWKSWNV